MTKDMGFKLSRIGQIAVTVKDVERATAFYRDKLELKFLFGAGNMAFFDCGGIRLLLGLAEKPDEAHRSSILYFHVDDIHAAHESLRSRGVVFEQEPHFVANMGKYDLWIGFFRDSEENTHGIMAEVAK
jgi:methylmalonyl-CoA/ethylmalonyl-CoA epimerase